MPFTSNDRAAIKLVREEKGWGAKEFCESFGTSSVREPQ